MKRKQQEMEKEAEENEIGNNFPFNVMGMSHDWKYLSKDGEKEEMSEGCNEKIGNETAQEKSQSKGSKYVFCSVICGYL